MNTVSSPNLFNRRILTILLFLAILPGLVGPGCTLIPQIPLQGSQSDQVTSTNPPQPSQTPLPPPPETEVIFRVRVPKEGMDSNPLYLSVLDEVTGLGLNAEHYPMQEQDTGADDDPYRLFHINLMLPVGAAIKYRYERGASAGRVIENTTYGEPVRYRVYHVEGPGLLEDVVARWADTSYNSPTGRIIGQAIDETSGKPVPNVLVTAGGEQTLTALDGTYILEGLPPGVHNLVALTMDGAFRTFQQGARVAAQSATPADLKLLPAHYVTVTFLVSLPKDTPPVVPVHIAGSLRQFGNTFANLSSGTSGFAASMPVMTPMQDGRYSLTVLLPAGADLVYKYTLGDGFWNAEHARDGSFAIRRLVVPEETVLVEDLVESWQTSEHAPIGFDLNVPFGAATDEPPGIQFRMLLGWTEPMPMWRLAENRYAFILYSPLNLPGEIAYRYCYHGYCEGALAPGGGEARLISPDSGQNTIRDRIDTWPKATVIPTDVGIPVVESGPRSAPFAAGVELQPVYRYGWSGRIADFSTEAKTLGANTIFMAPSWTFTHNNPPQIELVPGNDPAWDDLLYAAEQMHGQGFQLAIFPTPHFSTAPAAFWQSAPRDFRWWAMWFERYGAFLRNQADLASRAGAEMLVIGGDWLAPALPDGRLADGTASGVPVDAEVRWKNLIGELRSMYNGQIYWAHPADDVEDLPGFISDVDGVYLLWPEILGQPTNAFETSLVTAAGRYLDGIVRPIMLLYDRPVIIGAAFPAEGDAQTQVEAYAGLLSLINERQWIGGLVTRGYTPPYPAPASPASVRGNPAAALLAGWFTQQNSQP